MEFVSPTPAEQTEANRNLLVERQKRNTYIFYIVAILNVLACMSVFIIFTIVQLKTNSDFKASGTETRYYFELLVDPQIIVGGLQILSFLTVTYSTLMIRNFIYKKKMQHHMKMTVMLLHMISFLFYVASGISYYIALINFYQHFSDPEKSSQAQLRALLIDTVVVGCTFLAQLFQLFILNWLTANREENQADIVRTRATLDREIHDADSEFEGATKV